MITKNILNDNENKNYNENINICGIQLKQCLEGKLQF